MLESSSDMEFPEDQYYKLNRVLLSSIGLWPYDDFKVRQLRFLLTLFFILSFIGTQLMKLFVSDYNFNLLIKILSCSIVILVICIKHVTFYAVIKNVKEFRERVRNNWNALTDNREIEIIRKQASTGKLFTMFIATTVYCFIFLCIFTQYISILLDIIIPLNDSRPCKIAFVAEYFIDQQKYFHIIAIHVGIALFIVATIGIATESFSVTNALHAFGLFKIASYRMEHVLSEFDSHMCTKKYIISYGKIIAAVDFHRRALEFSELLRTSFGPAYLFLFIIGVISASINLCNLSNMILIENETSEMINYTILLSVHFIYLTIANYAGQEFINCDTHFYRTICQTQWYNAPLKTQNLIFFLIQKTTRCYKVDAGGMFSPSLEGLATSISMMVSYFMVLRSA